MARENEQEEAGEGEKQLCGKHRDGKHRQMCSRWASDGSAVAQHMTDDHMVWWNLRPAIQDAVVDVERSSCGISV